NLTTTATSPGAIQLAWAGVSGATGYKIERSPDGAGGWAQIATTAASTTSFLNTGLSAATTYYYRVRDTSGGGDSSPSNLASATTMRSTLPAPTNLRAGAISSSAIQLTWTGVGGATGYKVYRSLDGRTWSLVTTVASGTTSFLDTGLSPNTLYY